MNQLTLNDYLSIIRRRAGLLLGTFFGLLAIVLAVALAIPPVFQSAGVIMVESQEVPQALLPDTASILVDERIEIIRQRVMTRENLLKIIEKYQLFADSTRPLTVSDKIDEMRKLITVEPIIANVSGAMKRQGKGTIAFKLSFDHRSPNVAHRVASDLITLFLDENIKSRTERAAQTTEFLTQQANSLKAELEKSEAQIAAYKREHSTALPQQAELRMSMVSRAESELRDLQREYSAAQVQLPILDMELSAARAGVPGQGGGAGRSGPQDLGSLKAEYARLSSLYTEAHPDVRAIKRKIDALEAVGGGAKGGAKESEAVSAEEARVKVKIAAAHQRMDSLDRQIKDVRAKIASYERDAMQMPQVEQGLIALMRDHDNALKKYEEIQNKQMTAKVTENLEQENKAERFTLIEPPVLPEKPYKPDRIKILLIGLVLAGSGSAGVAFLLETLNKRIRGQEALALAIRQRPIAVIPYITTDEETSQRRRTRRKFAKVLIIAIALLAILVHVLYMPLDMLVFRIIARFG